MNVIKKIWTTKDVRGRMFNQQSILYKGTCINVSKETKKFYIGYASQGPGTFEVKVKKIHCTERDPWEDYKEAFRIAAEIRKREESDSKDEGLQIKEIF